MIYLIRHAKPSKSNIILGQCDPPLDPTFNNLKVRDMYFPDNCIVIASPLHRAKQTAKIFGYEDPIIDDRIMEMDLGKFQGKKLNKENLEQVFSLQNSPNSNAHEGETFHEFINRLQSFWNEYKDQDLIVFTHSGVIRALLIVILKLADKDYSLDYLNFVQIDPLTSCFDTKAIRLQIA